MTPRLTVRPLTPDRWDDLVQLFSRPGASVARHCWCMYYRRSGAGGTGEANRRALKALKALVDRGVVPGLLGYRDDRPVGWISLGPREDYAKLWRSPIMKPVEVGRLFLRGRAGAWPRRDAGAAARGDRLRPVAGSDAARGLPGGQAGARPSQLDVVWGPESL